MLFFTRLQRMRTRTSYDTAIKHLYRKGLEDVLPMSLRKKIPRNNIHRWRNEKEDKYEGSDLNDLAKSEIELLKEFVRSKNARRIFMTYVRIGRFIEKVAGEKVIRQQFKKHKADLIDVVERARQTLPLKQVLKCFNLSETTYNLWVLGMYSGCSNSILDWCLVRQPHQLKVEEVKKMEALLKDPEKLHWPISSIFHYAKRNDILHIGKATWYKYAKLLGIRRPKPRFRKRKYAPGIKANRPNEIWHADVTYFKIGLKKFYIYLVVDNFSKKIISHLVSDVLSAKNRVSTIKSAYEKEFGSLDQDVLLLVDGGSENNNRTVDNYINMLPNLTKLRALHDIVFGNTQVEAHNRILKQGWLYRKEFHEESELIHEVDQFVYEFNEIRPHDSIGGLTPSEKHDGAPDYFNSSFEKMAQRARQDRYESNRCNACATCFMNCKL
jgi:putative transposase